MWSPAFKLQFALVLSSLMGILLQTLSTLCHLTLQKPYHHPTTKHRHHSLRATKDLGKEWDEEPDIFPFTLEHTKRKKEEEEAQTAGQTEKPQKAATRYKVSTTIFYNVFVPQKTRRSRWEKAQSVVHEQLRQVAESEVVKNNTSVVQLKFVSIGSNETGSLVKDICRSYKGLDCVHIAHYQAGFESKTIVQIHPHCEEAHPQDRIIYMHNKGSFHQDRSDGPTFNGQDNWRRAMTSAATSHQCQRGLEENQCDVCGLIFQPLPYQHFPGNIWTTTCKYIQKVHKWKVLQTKRSAMFDKMIKEGHYRALLFEPVETMIGANRFMAEYWIGSRPDLRPCDVGSQQNVSLQYWRDENRPATGFSLTLAPHVPFSDPGWEFYRYATRPWVLQEQSDRLRDFYLLSGNLFKWKELYGETPDSSSWVWTWYPDGEEVRRPTFKGFG